MASSNGPKIAVIVPMYNKFAYARRACLSFFKYTESDGIAIVVDDASPYYKKQNWGSWYKGLPEDRIVFKHFPHNAGLTRGWNWGLKMAQSLGAEFAVCGNSDILFTPHWEHGLLHNLKAGYQLVGPVTNAPGPTNGGRQRVANYYPNYQVTDDPEYLARVADYLYKNFPLSTIHGNAPVNGFFMMAATQTWWDGKFDQEHVFNPAKKMTGNEDELQRRWRSRGWKAGFVPSSFIFHYRAVSRGDAFKHRGWYRINDINKPV